MKLLLDQGVPRRSAALLREKGHDAVHTSEVGLASATDLSILGWAREGGRVVVTLDADFHAALAVGGHAGPSVLRVRQQGLRGPEMATLIQTVIEQHGAALDGGAMLTVRSGRVRVRTLPVTKGKERP